MQAPTYRIVPEPPHFAPQRPLQISDLKLAIEIFNGNKVYPALGQGLDPGRNGFCGSLGSLKTSVGACRLKKESWVISVDIYPVKLNSTFNSTFTAWWTSGTRRTTKFGTQ